MFTVNVNIAANYSSVEMYESNGGQKWHHTWDVISTQSNWLCGNNILNHTRLSYLIIRSELYKQGVLGCFLFSQTLLSEKHRLLFLGLRYGCLSAISWGSACDIFNLKSSSLCTWKHCKRHVSPGDTGNYSHLFIEYKEWLRTHGPLGVRNQSRVFS